MKRKNPFKFGTVVKGEYFYNREEELVRIKQTLSGGNNVCLYAPRRYGKTSLVHKVLDELNEEGFITVYLDFMRVYSRETFIKNYSKEIAKSRKASLENTVKKIAKFISGIVPSVSFDNEGNPSFSFSWIEGVDKEKTLVDIIDLPEKLAEPNKKWIIAFDEFQEVTKLNGDSFEKILRSCIQEHQNVSYLFFGSKTHLLKDMFNNKNRAFYNAASVFNIGKISDEKSVEYLGKRFSDNEIKIEQETVEYLLNKVESIPYYIQFMAYELWQFAILNEKSKIEISDVDNAIDSVLRLKDDYYWELTNKQTAYRKKVLVALAHSSVELFSKEVTYKFQLGAASSTQKSVDVLMDDGIIERCQNKLEFSDPLYKKFVISSL